MGAYLSRLLCKMYKESHRLKYLLRTLFFSIMIISTYSIRITSAEKIELQHIIIGADKDTIDNFKKFTEITPIKKITTFNNPYTGYRAVVELVLIHQAIKLGGLETEIILKEMPNYARSVLQASHGKLDMPSETLWGLDIDETLFYKTDPIIRKYEQEMGIFVLPELNGTYKVNSLKDLQNLSAVVQKTWIMDVATLKDMKISRIEYTSTINSMYKMVEAKRVNFLLWTFSSMEDMGQTFNDIHLTPLPNIKVGIGGSRHFVVSKKAKNGKKIFAALQEGIRILRENGAIVRALEQSGSFNARVKNWKRIYPEKLEGSN